MNEQADHVRQLSDKIQEARQRILEYMGQHQEVFDEWLAIIGEHNELCRDARRVLKGMTFDKFTGKTFGEFSVQVRGCNKFDVDAIRRIDAAVFGLPGVVKSVDEAVVLQAISTGTCSAAVRGAYIEEKPTVAVIGPKEIVLEVGK